MKLFIGYISLRSWCFSHPGVHTLWSSRGVQLPPSTSQESSAPVCWVPVSEASPRPLYCYSLMDVTSWNQTVLIPFMLCDPNPLFLILQGYKWQHSKVWTAGVTGKQRLIDWKPEQSLGNTFGMNSHAGLKPPSITSLKLPMFLSSPCFHFLGNEQVFYPQCYKPQGKFPLKTYSEKVPHSHLLTHNHPLKQL